MITKRQRVEAAIRGDAVDQVPFGIWLHNFAEEYSDEALATETLRLYERFDFDFIKPQTRAHCFGEMWGQEMEPPAGRDFWPVTKTFAVRADGDLDNLRQVPANAGALAEQVRAYRRIRAAVGQDVHIIATVFSPMMNLTLMHQDGKPGALRLQDSAPDALERALDGMSSTLEEYVALCRDAGVDGLFYATTTGNLGETTDAQFERFQRPFDDRILSAAKDCPINVLHICGPAIHAPWFKDHAANVYSWATTPGNPSLQDMYATTGRTVMSGAPAKPTIAKMQPAELAEHVQRSLQEMQGRHHILGPDCSINSNTSPELMDVIADTVKKYRPAAH